jgi:hypothetical protein
MEEKKIILVANFYLIIQWLFQYIINNNKKI